MPDGSISSKTLVDPFASQTLGGEWSRMSGVADSGDLVALEASARFAELAAKALTAEVVQATRAAPRETERDPADPLDQVAADWVARVEADEQIVHAFLGIDDPIGREARATFEEDRVDAALEIFLENLPDNKLENGELAALSAFDAALASGFDAEEALSAAIQAAEQIDASASIAAAIAQSSSDAGLGLDVAAFPETSAVRNAVTQSEQADQVSPEPDPAPAPFIPSIPAETLSAFVGGQLESVDSAFGFGFQFDPGPVDLFVPAANRAPTERSEVVTVVQESVNYTSIIGSSAANLLVGGGGRDAIGGLESDDYIYADQPTNYDVNVHDAATPLTAPVFSVNGGHDIVAGGAGDDSLWGGAGDDQIHGDLTDTSTGLFTEFEFGLGAGSGGDDYISGGSGDDSLWGGAGADVLTGDSGNDTLSGDAGDDTLSGGSGIDNLFGYAGDDIIRGGEGNDTLSGGDGADTFEFSEGSGATVAERVQSLGTDTISDYSSADMDTFSLSDADFGLGNSGVLTDGSTYFEIADGILSDAPFDVSGGASGAAILVMGANSGADGVGVYYTEDASAASNLNSYQIADLISVNASDFEAADFLLKS